MNTTRLLGLFAHPDDEVFCVGGTFAEAAAGGAETMVVAFTHGEAGRIRHADIATRTTLAGVRERELRAACDELGVAHARCLDFDDGRLAETDRETLVRAAVELIREFRPTTVYSFGPDGGTGHPDHVRMADVARAACERAGLPEVDAGRFEPYSPDQLLQAWFPRSDRLLLDLLVDWLTSLDVRYRGSEEFMTSLLTFADGSSMLGYASDHLCTRWFPAGSYVIEQGEPATSLYLVLSGSVDIIAEEDDGRRTHVATAGVGEFLGEIGIATGEVRSAHCVAAENTTCFVLSASSQDHHAARGPRQPVSTPAPGRSDDGDRASPPPEVVADVHNDVGDQVPRKIAALGRHASQYAVGAEVVPESMFEELLGTEHFRRAWTPDHDRPSGRGERNDLEREHAANRRRTE